MGIELNFIQWLKLRMDQEKEHCHRKLEYCLIRAFSDMRSIEMKKIKLSDNFDDRLYAQLADIPVIKESFRDRFLDHMIHNKKMNYALAGSLAAVISAIVIYNSDMNNTNAEPASVVKGNTNFIDQPSSQNYMTAIEENEFMDEIKRNPGNLEMLLKLEKYYANTGKKQAAQEIREIINRIR